MFSTILNGLMPSRRRPTAARRDAKSRCPLLESMEDRRLLTTLILVDDVMVTEGNGGYDSPTQVTFTVSLMIPTSEPVTIDYQTSDVTATGEDYVPTSGTLAFAPGELSKTISVDVVGDGDIEPAEAYHVNISNASTGWIIKSIGVGTILDDDTPVDPALSINDRSMIRGYDGTVQGMDFTVSLNTAVSEPVSVRATTLDLTAVAGGDYEWTSQVLTFEPGETSKTFSVSVFGTSTPSPDAIFLVVLSEATVPLNKMWAVGNLRYGG